MRSRGHLHQPLASDQPHHPISGQPQLRTTCLPPEPTRLGWTPILRRSFHKCPTSGPSQPSASSVNSLSWPRDSGPSQPHASGPLRPRASSPSRISGPPYPSGLLQPRASGSSRPAREGRLHQGDSCTNAQAAYSSAAPAGVLQGPMSDW